MGWQAVLANILNFITYIQSQVTFSYLDRIPFIFFTLNAKHQSSKVNFFRF